MSTDKLNARQTRILELMRAMPTRRDLYETAAPGNTAIGSGRFAVTYTPDEQYEYATAEDVKRMVALGLIEQLYPGCYTLAGEPRYDRKGNVIARNKEHQ